MSTSAEELAGRIKAKFPDYADVPDYELAAKVISKYPDYGAILSPFDRHALNEGVSPKLVRAIAGAEGTPSGVTSGAGAMGQLQVIPETGLRYVTRQEWATPEGKILAGVRYLKHLTDRFGIDNADQIAAAYHAGEGSVDAAMKKGRRLPHTIDQVVSNAQGKPFYTDTDYVPRFMSRYEGQPTSYLASVAKNRSYAPVSRETPQVDSQVSPIAPPPTRNPFDFQRPPAQPQGGFDQALAEIRTKGITGHQAAQKLRAQNPTAEMGQIAAAATPIALRNNPNLFAALSTNWPKFDGQLTSLPQAARWVVETMALGGAHIEDALAGAADFLAQNPMPQGRVTMEAARDWLMSQSASVKGLSREAPQMSTAASLTRDLGAGAVGFAPVIAATGGAGLVPSAIAGGLYSGAQSRGRGESGKEQLLNTGLGAAQFALQGIPAASLPLKTALGRAALKVGLVSGGTTASELLAGRSPEEALKSGAIMGFISSPEFLHGLKWYRHADLGEVVASPDQVGVRAGKLRVLDAEGDPHVIIQPSRARNQRAVPLTPPKFSELPDVPVGTIDKPRVVKPPPETREQYLRRLQGEPLEPQAPESERLARMQGFDDVELSEADKRAIDTELNLERYLEPKNVGEAEQSIPRTPVSPSEQPVPVSQSDSEIAGETNASIGRRTGIGPQREAAMQARVDAAKRLVGSIAAGDTVVLSDGTRLKVTHVDKRNDFFDVVDEDGNANVLNTKSLTSEFVPQNVTMPDGSAGESGIATIERTAPKPIETAPPTLQTEPPNVTETPQLNISLPDHPIAAQVVRGEVNLDDVLDAPVVQQAKEIINEANAIQAPTERTVGGNQEPPPVAPENQAGAGTGTTAQAAEAGRINPPPRVAGERQFPKSAEAAGLPEATNLTYDVVSDAGAVERANARIAKDGAERVAADLARNTNPTKDDIVAGELLAHQLTATGDIEGAVNVIDDLATKLTNAGQQVQAASLIGRLTPEGLLLKARRQLGRSPTPEQATEVLDAGRQAREAEAKFDDLSRKYDELQRQQLAMQRDSGTRVTSPASARQRIGTLADRLASMEQEARARLQQRAEKAQAELRGEKGQRGSGANPAGVGADIADYAIIGASKLARKGVTLAQWTEEMLREFGDDIKPHIKALYQQSYQLYEDQRKGFLQEQRERSARKSEPDANNLQAVVNDRLDAATELRKSRAHLLSVYEKLNAPGYQKALTAAGDVAGLTRAAQTTGDLSWGLRQGKMALGRDVLGFFENRFKPADKRRSYPWFEGFAKQKTAINEKAYDRLLSEIETDSDYKYMRRGGLELAGVQSQQSGRLASHEEGFQSGLVKDIPVLKQSEMAYNAMGDWVKSRWFKERLNVMRELGVDLESPEGMRQLKLEGQLINDATGRASLGRYLNAASPIINQLTYSARFWASRLKWIAKPLDPRMYELSSKAGFEPFPRATRVEAWKTLGAFYALVGGQVALLKAAGAQVDTDPDSPDFLKARLGPMHVDLSAGFQGHLRFMAHFVKSMWLMEHGKKLAEKDKPVEVVGRYLRSKESPNASLVHDTISGTDYKGDPSFLLGDPKLHGFQRFKDSALGERVIPMVLKDVSDAYDLMGWKGVAATAPLTILGEGVTVYDKNKKKRRSPRQ